MYMYMYMYMRGVHLLKCIYMYNVRARVQYICNTYSLKVLVCNWYTHTCTVYNILKLEFFIFTRLEIVVEPWIDGLWSPLEAVLSSSTSLNSTAHADCEGSSNVCAEGVSGPSSNYTTGEENQTMDHQATAADSRDIGSVESGNKIKTTTLKQAVSNDSFLGQDRPSVGDTVEETSTVVGELAVPFQDKLSISPQPTGQSNAKTAVMDTVTMSSAQSDKVKTDQSTCTCSTVEKMAAIPSVEGERGSKQRISREETATKDELKTPSMELASIPLTLPSVPPSFIKVLLKNVCGHHLYSLCMYMYIIVCSMQMSHSHTCIHCMNSMVYYTHVQCMYCICTPLNSHHFVHACIAFMYNVHVQYMHVHLYIYIHMHVHSLILLLQVFADSANVEFPFTKMQYALKTSVSMATVVKSRLLTREGSVKKTMELEISLEVHDRHTCTCTGSNCDVVMVVKCTCVCVQDCPSFNHYQPGDAFGFVCPNPADEVSWLLQRYSVQALIKVYLVHACTCTCTLYMHVR